MKRWFRWRRWLKSRGLVVGSVAGVLGCMNAVILTDTVTKLYVQTPAWGWHHVTPIAFWPILMFTPLLFCTYVRWPAAIMMAGALSNTAWTHRASGVANPFVADLSDGVSWTDAYGFVAGGYGQVAYNFADCCIAVGQMWVFVAMIVWAVKAIRASRGAYFTPWESHLSRRLP